LQRILWDMDSARPSRYMLVPRTARPGTDRDVPAFKRYSLARVQPSPRSALGEDRHERLERAAGQRPRRS
jgi:hypothetical protein